MREPPRRRMAWKMTRAAAGVATGAGAGAGGGALAGSWPVTTQVWMAGAARRA